VALRIPIISWSGWDNLSDHEPSVDRLLSRMLAATSGTVVDVGVNTGQILMKVKTKEPNREYIGFEASMFCCFYVDQLVRKLGFLVPSDPRPKPPHYSLQSGDFVRKLRRSWLS
jgi:hypothetical protein